MKLVILSYLVIVSTATEAQNWKDAEQIVAINLKIISNYLSDINSDSTLKRIRAISFLTRLTGIQSESDGSYIGQLSPTARDLELWKSWLNDHKKKLGWKANKNCIIFDKRRIEAPIYK